MSSAALGAGAEKAQKIIFISEAHLPGKDYRKNKAYPVCQQFIYFATAPSKDNHLN